MVARLRWAGAHNEWLTEMFNDIYDARHFQQKVLIRVIGRQQLHIGKYHKIAYFKFHEHTSK